MLILSLLVARATSAECGPGQALSGPETLVLRGHTYTRIGACGILPVYRTPSTDSTFLDREAARQSKAIILVTDESVDPTTAEDAWPAPTGNLYLSYPYPGHAERAREAVSAAISAWREQHAPEVAMTEGWDDLYGAHRAADGRFLTGLALSPRLSFVDIGLDLHLAATPEQYAALSAEGEHVSVATLTGAAPDPEAALWFILSALYAHADETITADMYSVAAEHIFWELERHGVREEGGGVVSEESIGGPLTIKGFARNSRHGAIIARAATLARCDAADRWPEEIEGRFVTASGRLAWLGVEHEAAVLPEFDLADTAVLQLVDCAVRVGVQAEDVAPEKWQVLRASGITAELGESITVRGKASRHHDGVAVQVGEASLWLRGRCEVEGAVEVSGVLDYVMPRYLRGVAPRVELVKMQTGYPDTFSINVTECVPTKEGKNGDQP